MTLHEHDQLRALRMHARKGLASPGQLVKLDELETKLRDERLRNVDPFAEVGAKFRARLDQKENDRRAQMRDALAEFDRLGRK